MKCIGLISFAVLLTACGGPTDAEVRDAIQQGSYKDDFEIAELSWRSSYSMATAPGNKESRYTVKYTVIRRSKLPLLERVEPNYEDDGRYVSPYEIHCPLSPSSAIPSERELPTVYRKTLPAGTLAQTQGEILMTKAPDETRYTQAVSEPSIFDPNAKAYLYGSTSVALNKDNIQWVEQGSSEFKELCDQLNAEVEK